MIFILAITYDIEAGKMKILDFKTKIFEDTVIITSDSFNIKGLKGIQGENVVKIMGNVSANSGNTNIICDSVIFYPKNGVVTLFDNIVITRGNYNFSGDAGSFFIDYDSGYVYKKFFLKTDSSIIQGNYASFNKERVKIFKEPVYKRKKVLISSDTIIYNFNDSTAQFINNVNIKSEEVNGFCGKFFYDDIKNSGKFYYNPIFITKTDSIVCDSGYFDFNTNTGLSYNTKIISNTEDGKNFVSGDFARFFFGKDKLDSLFLFKNTKGELVKNDTLNKKP